MIHHYRGSGKTGTAGGPETGDDTGLRRYLLLAAGSLALILWITRKARRRHREWR